MLGSRGAMMLSSGSRRIGLARARRGIKTNPHVEEWMGKREITEKTFTFNPLNSFGFFMTLVVFPTWVYYNIKEGMQKKDAKLGREREYL